MYDICKRISDSGTILVAAFDNVGGISFPATFDNVIGVDSSYECTKISDFEYVENSVVDIRGRGILQRVAWKEPEYIMARGSSFTCGYITGYSAKFFQKGKRTKCQIVNEFRKYSKKNHDTQNKNNGEENEKYNLEISKAAIFPYNKEMHALTNFAELLAFEIVNIYDLRLSGRVGSKISSRNKGKEWIIRNIKEINWETIDTIIIGHTEELLNYVNDIKFQEALIKEALKHQVNIYSFDDLSSYQEVIKMNNAQEKVYWPRIEEKYRKNNRFGKMFSTTKPIIGIFGTHSRQGKYTLQLELRKKFISEGYKIGQIGTEPNACLFGIDCIYNSGYKSNISASIEDAFYILNNMIWEISEKDVDIIMVGSQAGVIPYNTYNIQSYPIGHQIFLQAVRPDAVILCFNYNDETEYIDRTIKAVEALGECKVVGLVCFPEKFKEGWSGIVGGKVDISYEEEIWIKNKVESELNIPVYILSNNEDIQALYKACIEYFS